MSVVSFGVAPDEANGPDSQISFLPCLYSRRGLFVQGARISSRTHISSSPIVITYVHVGLVVVCISLADHVVENFPCDNS